jgi:integrase
MASITLKETKAGKRYWQICVSRGYGKAPYKTRFYWPLAADGEPVAKSTAERELNKAAAEFERACAAGEIMNRAQAKQKEAEEAAEAAARAAAEAAEAEKLKTVRQYADGVFMPTKEATMTPNGCYSYRMNLDKHILPAIGDLLLIDVKPAIIQKLIVEFQKAGYKHASVVKLYNILNGLFNMAFMDDSIPISPMLKVKRPAPRKDENLGDDRKKAYTSQELSSVLSCVAQEPLKWQAYVYLSSDTGARRGEVCGLQWADIDFKTGAVRIQRNLQYTSLAGVYVSTPKNGKTRTVYLDEITLGILRRWRDEQAASCISQWIFTRDNSPEPMHPQTPTRYFEKFGRRYGIKDFHPHILRHTAASIALTNGADTLSVSERLGHSDPAFTIKMYGHANEDSIRKVGQVVWDAIHAAND